MIEVLQAHIQKYEADAARLTQEIAAHDADISTWTGDSKASTKVREIEHEDYVTTKKDYDESLAALDEAIMTVKKTAEAAPSMLIQLSALRIPDDSKNLLTTMLAQQESEMGAPEASAYEFQGQAILDMLTKLEGKFTDEQTALEKAEVANRQSFEVLSQDLKAQIGAATQARTEKTQAKATALQKAADAKSDLQDTTQTRDDDVKYLADLTATCEQKSSDFANRQQLRAEEIEAVEKAIEILSSGEVSGASEKHLPQFMQIKSSSLVQLRSANQNPNQMKVAAYLKSQASKFNSKVLTALAVRVESDPFKKVTKMIKDLIVKLMEEAAAESEHKGLCDSELATNEQTRKEKTEAIETLHAEIDSLEAGIAKLTRHIKELNTAVSELDAAVAKATSVREEEKAKNTMTIKDSQDAQIAVNQALTVLKEFYDKAATATSFVQQPLESERVKKEIFDEPYKGMGGENGGVVGMIEVISSDFARLESETTSAESESAKMYEEFMHDSQVDKAAKTKDIAHKEGKKQNSEQMLQEAKTDMAGTQKELDAALSYYEKLKPSCVDAGESYEDRVARREEEIQSLQEALKILDGEAV
jgi:prefoldin subunit 5